MMMNYNMTNLTMIIKETIKTEWKGQDDISNYFRICNLFIGIYFCVLRKKLFSRLCVDFMYFITTFKTIKGETK